MLRESPYVKAPFYKSDTQEKISLPLLLENPWLRLRPPWPEAAGVAMGGGQPIFFTHNHNVLINLFWGRWCSHGRRPLVYFLHLITIFARPFLALQLLSLISYVYLECTYICSQHATIYSKSWSRWSQTPQMIWIFPQKACLRTQKLSIMQYVRNKGEEAIAAILLLDTPSHCSTHNKHTSWFILTFYFRMMHFLDFWLIYVILLQNVVVAIYALFRRFFENEK